MTYAVLTSPDRELNDPELLRQVNDLRRPDNVTNWFYLAREYLFLGVVVGGTIAFYHWLDYAGLSWLWAVPVTLLAIILVGAGQHRLATLTHEAAHYMLFKNRVLNELVSEWFCMYPLLSGTHNYRVQHLGHHQYPNDIERDPDVSQMHASGHKFQFPMSRWRFLWHCVLKQFLWLPHPIRYILVRAIYVPDGGEGSPYRLKRRPALVLKLVPAVYFVILVAALAWFVWTSSAVSLAVVPAAMLAGMYLFYAVAPERWFPIYIIKNDLPVRFQSGMRGTFHTLVLTGLAWLTYLTGQAWWLYWFILWVVPLGTSFAFFMILRQIVQHGNATSERLTNTRIFEVNWFISCAVFPIGNDYHLPHHLFPMVPHYNLRKLHDLLMGTEVYRTQATLVEGYFFPRERPPVHPTVLDLMTK
jgi:fatty acid desaturase